MSLKGRLLLGVPAWDGILAAAQEAFCGLCYHLGASCPHVEVSMQIVTRREQFRARNLLVAEAERLGCDWLLMLDDDMLPPPDLFQQLAQHDKGVVGALYWQRAAPYSPVAMRCTPAHKTPQFLAHDAPELTTPGLYPVDVVGGGCVLYQRHVWHSIAPPPFWPDLDMSTDVGLCLRLRHAGIEIYLDTSLAVPHLGDPERITSAVARARKGHHDQG